MATPIVLAQKFKKSVAALPEDLISKWKTEFEKTQAEIFPGALEGAAWHEEKRCYTEVSLVNKLWMLFVAAKRTERSDLDNDVPVLDVHGHAEKKPDTTPALLRS